MFLPFLLLLALAAGVLTLPQDTTPSAAAGSDVGTATISGFVFHDLDADGLRDEGEPGLRRLVQLVEGDVIVQEGGSELDGSYSFVGVPAGEYQLVTELDALRSFCLDPALPNFDPLLVAGCVGYIFHPWHPTTPEGYTISVGGTETVRRDFGAWPFDQSVLLGLAIEGDYVPPGTVIEASANGQICGTATVPNLPFSGTHYRITIVGAEEQPGCPTAGQPVTMRVGGLEASESPIYIPQVDQTEPRLFIQNLVAMPNRGWFWLQEPSAALPPDGTKVEAFVAGVLCGETVLRTQSGAFFPPATGFHRLVVPSDSVEPGCGRPGATVEFRFGDSGTVTWADWQPGVWRLSLDAAPPSPTFAVSPSPSPTPAPTPLPAALPQAGGAVSRERNGFELWMTVVAIALATVGTALLCLAASKSLRFR